MTKHEAKAETVDIKGLLAGDEDFLRAGVEALVQAALEAEMTEAIGAGKGERTETRISYRSGYYNRSLITRVGTLELRVPQDLPRRKPGTDLAGFRPIYSHAISGRRRVSVRLWPSCGDRPVIYECQGW
jgi:hypothetical protein